jgi:hypothetical protein
MKRKTIDMLPSDLGEVAHNMSITAKVKLLGSNSYRGFIYPSDVDLYSKTNSTEHAVWKFFQKLFRSKDYQTGAFLFMDFKAGLDENLQYHDESKAAFLKRIKPIVSPDLFAKAKKGDDISAVHWTPEEIIAGKKGNRQFKDSLDGMIKLDVAVPVGNTFYDVTEVNKFRAKAKKQVTAELQADADAYSHSNAMKAMKRMYAYLQFTGTNKRLQSNLVYVFNSALGGVNKNDMLGKDPRGSPSTRPLIRERP